ncbi:hypothetical protein [Arthrobacter sp. S39]|uniref:hypothetical protein n=1 Tax=Arthrobacter sp. S39 TaxID=2509720 RepID=UPI0010372576|nr:hypothetical protein [Arthrobacter sp. S39]TAP43173.1 hypothetical protein EYS21_13520 [Arthrobacter sp. S39]
MIEHLYQQACGLLSYLEKLVRLSELNRSDRAAIDGRLDDLRAAANGADAVYLQRGSIVAGCTYKHFQALAFPDLNYAPIWESHTFLVSESIDAKKLVRFRRRAEKNLGYTRRRFWSTPPPFGEKEKPLSRYCARLEAAPDGANRRRVKKYLKKQIQLLQVLVVGIAPLATPRDVEDQEDLFKRSAALSVGNSVVHCWKRNT